LQLSPVEWIRVVDVEIVDKIEVVGSVSRQGFGAESSSSRDQHVATNC
jgi:hypothetical protein